MAIQYDESQQRVIAAQGGSHLVLAPPGCGKTQILAERIRVAHDMGVPYSDMLCLTFTNRAARGMMERIQSNLDGTAEVYVGNVHRFCSKFLFANGLVAAESAVIDEDDAVSILANFMQEDEYAVTQNYNRRRVYAMVLHLANFMEQIRHGHAPDLRMHPECINADDIASMRRLCDMQRKAFNAKSMVDLYDHADTYMTLINNRDLDFGGRQATVALLSKMVMAHQYADYKREHHLLDFQELLIRTYDALAADAEQQYRRYRWLQVDEVQDLNALQMAIIDLLTADTPETVMFLGDEQQAIFSFMGAKMGTLERLKRRCEGHIHHLAVNHRSPKYLLDAFNTYATQVLHIDSSLLPATFSQEAATGKELGLMKSETVESEFADVAEFARQLYNDYPSATTAIVVNANDDAQLVSRELRERGVPHFKVSGTDLFSLPEVKLLTAHLGVLAGECSFLPWARIMKGMRVFEFNATARKFVRELLDRAILPSDLIHYGGKTTYVQNFVEDYENRDIVVFDTETTGLDVCHDDIVQIAAVKMRHGQIVAGSAFCVFIATDKPIPQKLGDIDNPLIEALKHHQQLSHEDALRQFMDYAEGCVLLAHNADYDYNILDYNLQRYCNGIDLHRRHPHYTDSLRLVRLLEPELKEHKLKYLLTALHLEGSNTHLADDDVNATCSVVTHCYAKAKSLVGDQQKFLQQKRVKERIEKLCQNYGNLYIKGKERLFRLPKQGGSSLSDELKGLYIQLTERGFVTPVENLGYLFDYLSQQLINTEKEPLLAQQLAAHYMEISTLKEADLCGSSSMRERIFVTTIHKAKGLEFDNVIVFDAVEGRIPNFYSQNSRSAMEEDARKFYVAITRAKRRLYVAQSLTRIDWHNVRHSRQLTRFMLPIVHLFSEV